ncbi:hypothetical protein ACJW30_07G059100 [Castanea mollissima]
MITGQRDEDFTHFFENDHIITLHTKKHNLLNHYDLGLDCCCACSEGHTDWGKPRSAPSTITLTWSTSSTTTPSAATPSSSRRGMTPPPPPIRERESNESFVSGFGFCFG